LSCAVRGKGLVDPDGHFTETKRQLPWAFIVIDLRDRTRHASCGARPARGHPSAMMNPPVNF